MGDVGIEVNGVYWHREGLGLSQLQKQELASSAGVRLIHFYDYEILEKPEIVKSIIRNALHKVQTKIDARKCIVKIIETSVARRFLDENHLAGFSRSKLHYGVFYNEVLVSVLSVGTPRWSDHDAEIIRFATLKNHVLRGGFTKALKFFIKQESPKNIISYCDLRFGTGGVYKNAGFTLDGITKPNYFWSKGRVRFPRYQTQKHKLSSILNVFDPALSERENMLVNGYTKVPDCGNQRWVLSL
jgi:hypothetical protein